MALELFFVSVRTNKRHHHQETDRQPCTACPARTNTMFFGSFNEQECVSRAGYFMGFGRCPGSSFDEQECVLRADYFMGFCGCPAGYIGTVGGTCTACPAEKYKNFGGFSPDTENDLLLSVVTCSPNLDDRWVYKGIYNSMPFYQKIDSDYMLFYWSASSSWRVHNILESTSGNPLYKSSSSNDRLGCPRTMTGVSQYWFSGHFRQVFSTPMHYPALTLAPTCGADRAS